VPVWQVVVLLNLTFAVAFGLGYTGPGDAGRAPTV
jgi:hypothetical protein